MNLVHLIVHPDPSQDRNRRAGDRPVYCVHLEFHLGIVSERKSEPGDTTYTQRAHIDLEEPLFPNRDTEDELFLHTCK